MTEKQCSKCGETKLVEEFSPRKKAKDGLQAWCRPCMRTAVTASYNRRKDSPEFRKRNRKRAAAWAKANPERTKKRQRDWSQRPTVKAKIRKRQAERLATDKEYREAAYARIRDWGRRNKGRKRKHWQDYHARKLAAFIEDVDHEVVYERDGGCCYLCGEEITFEEMHLDHVIPLAAGVEAGGVHSYANCKCACAHCNLIKGTKILAA